VATGVDVVPLLPVQVTAGLGIDMPAVPDEATSTQVSMYVGAVMFKEGVQVAALCWWEPHVTFDTAMVLVPGVLNVVTPLAVLHAVGLARDPPPEATVKFALPLPGSLVV
jgi:hypothetical protein